MSGGEGGEEGVGRGVGVGLNGICEEELEIDWVTLCVGMGDWSGFKGDREGEGGGKSGAVERGV